MFIAHMLTLRIGVAGGGYVFAFGVARAVRDLIDEFVYQSPVAKL